MTDVSSSPLSFALREIHATYQAKLYYAAIILCLTLPDMCAASEFEEGDEAFWNIQKRYETWCDRYLIKHLSALTSTDIWALRGGVIHRGQTFGHPKNRFERVAFILPDGRHNIFNGIVTQMQGGLPLHSVGVDVFCQAFFDAAHEWMWSCPRAWCRS